MVSLVPRGQSGAGFEHVFDNKSSTTDQLSVNTDRKVSHIKVSIPMQVSRVRVCKACSGWRHGDDSSSQMRFTT
jgi:hypothetical protein